MNALLLVEKGVNDEFQYAAEVGLTAVSRAAHRLGALSLRKTTIDNLPTLPSGQVDSAIVDQMRPWLDDTLTILMTGRDLGAKGLNYCFGRSQFNGGNMIVSSARLELVDMVGLVAHETGHAQGLVGFDSRQYNKESRFEGHCKNECVMLPVNNYPDMRRVARQIFEHSHSGGFCKDCTSYLETVTLT